ncbi:hypothetical protein L6R52_22300 [Myxococcota bacterium]|nr:hypothetical protein [Myxococcota bacterium]
MRLEHDVRAGEVVFVRALRAELAPLIVDASGTIHATGRPRAELAFSTNAIDLVALARVVPALAISADRAELRATGTVRGTLDDPSSQTITVDALTLRAAETELTGTARLQNPARPAISFTLASPMLDVDALTPKDAGPERTPAERTPEERRALANLDVRGTLRAARGVLKGVAFQDLDVALTIRQGVVGFERLAASAWGGRVDGAGTRFDVVREAVELAVKLRGTAADTLLARSAALSNVLTGSIDADLELSFHGLEWDAIAKTLGGRAELALEGGRLTSFALPDAVAKPLAAALPFARDFAGLGAADGGGTALRTLRVAFDVGGGLLKIARALEVTTPHGTANLAGAVGLDGALALAGSFAFTPDTIATLTRRRVQLDRALPVAIELGCTLRAPCLEGVNVERAATALTEAAAGRVKREVLERAAAPVEDAKEKAEAEATKRLEEQKRRGEARKKELEEEAKRRAKDFLGF